LKRCNVFASRKHCSCMQKHVRSGITFRKIKKKWLMLVLYRYLQSLGIMWVIQKLAY
jgi:hypothetical protein